MAWRIHNRVVRGEIDNRTLEIREGILKLMDEYRGRS
jgi:hypothetical protein